MIDIQQRHKTYSHSYNITSNNQSNYEFNSILCSLRAITIMAIIFAVATTSIQRMTLLSSSSSSSMVVSGWTMNRRYFRTLERISLLSNGSGLRWNGIGVLSKDSMKRRYYHNHQWQNKIHMNLNPKVTPHTILFSTIDSNDMDKIANNMTTSILINDESKKDVVVSEPQKSIENITETTSTMVNTSMSMGVPRVEANDTTQTVTTTTTTSENNNTSDGTSISTTTTTSSSTSSSSSSSSTVDTSNICGSSILAIDPADILISIEPSWTPVENVNGSNCTMTSSTSAAPITTTTSTSSSQQQQQPSQSDLLRRLPFVSMFRGSANYIANHRNTVAVYHIPGGLLCSQNHTSSNPMIISEKEMIFRDLMNDVALTWLLGIKIVIVVGCRHQIEQRLIEKQKRQQELIRLKNNSNNTSSTTTTSTTGSTIDDIMTASTTNNNIAHAYDVVTSQHGLRVTSPEILRIVKEEAGYVRFEVERQLARSLRLQGGGTTVANAAAATGGSSNNGGIAIPSSNGGGFIDNKGKLPPSSVNSMSSNGFTASSSTNSGAINSAYFDGNVVSGNFYSAQPFGILDGVDYQYSGFVRRVEVEKIRQLHASRDICLLTTLGVSPSGEVFNVNSESLAAIVAGAMEASKVVYFTEQEVYLRHKVHGNKIQSLRLNDGLNFLNYYGIQMHSKGFVTMSNGVEETERRKELNAAQMDMLLKIGWCTGAIGLGVKRAHIITPQHGALLQELYTRDGSGTLISADLYEGIRRATVLDVSAIHAIISPLIAAGTLIDRPKAQLEKDIDQYYIYTRDKDIIACGQLKKFENGFSEIGCLVVNKDFRSRGRGDAMLGYLERLSLLNNCTNIFVLSTQTMEWFVERGFDEAVVAQLPPSRQATYNHKRASKIYIKKIESDRDLDASELWWNR